MQLKDRELLRLVLTGNRQKYREFKARLDEPDAPSPQEVADFCFKEHQFDEFMVGRFILPQLGRLIVDWYQQKAFATKKSVTIQLNLLAKIHAVSAIESFPEKISLLTEVINHEDAAPTIKALAYNNRGRTYTKKGYEEKSHQDFSMARKLAPNYAAAYFNDAEAFTKQGLLEFACNNYLKTLELDPEDLEAYFKLQRVYIKQKQYDLVIRNCSQKITSMPFINLYILRGKALYAKGELEKANCDFRKVYQNLPESSPDKKKFKHMIEKIEALQRSRKKIEKATTQLEREWSPQPTKKTSTASEPLPNTSITKIISGISIPPTFHKPASEQSAKKGRKRSRSTEPAITLGTSEKKDHEERPVKRANRNLGQ